MRPARHSPKVWSSLEHAGTHSSDEAYQAILLARALRDRSITHIHAHFGTSAASVARMASAITRIPYSITVHAKDIYHQDVDQSELRWKLREAGTTITVSDFNVTHLRRCFGDDAGRVRRIYNGLDLNEFSYEQPVDRPPTIVAVGRLIKKKGFGDLIDACAILAEHGRSFQCRIIGDGNLRDELANQIERLDLTDRVSLLGPKPRGEVITALRQASLIAAPCVVGPDGNRDGLPTVLLEGMALGTPCISTDVTGIPELVRDEDTGLITPQHDPAMLARKIECLLDDPQLRVALAERGRQLMEAEFDIHRNTEQMREIFSLNGATCAARVKEVV